MPFSRKAFLIAVITLLILITSACGNESAQAQQGPGKPGKPGKPKIKPAAVAVVPVERGVAESIYATTASLEAEHHAEIRARTNGVALEILGEEGDYVEKDQVILKLEDDDQRMQVKQAELALAQAEHEYKRGISLREAGILPDEQFDQKKNARDTAEAQLDEARLNLSYTRIRAPFSGRIVSRQVELGAHVQSGAVVFAVMDVSPLLARVHIPANRLKQVTVDQSLQLTLDSTGQNLEGRVSLISPVVDPGTGTVKVTVEIQDYPANTRPGDFARVNVVTDRHENAILVPSVAVFEEQGRNVLFVAKDGKAERRVVELGFVESSVTEIKSGINDGEMVVIKGQRNLRDGVPLKILEGPGTEADNNMTANTQGVGQ